MKNRTSLVLMELLVMVLVFALAAEVCLGVFAKADSISKETARRDAAVTLAQNAAEMLQATGGDAAQVLQKLNIPDGFSVEITPENSKIPSLGKTTVAVLWQGAETFRLTVGWQEVAK
jgi:hypothetical protein